MNIIGGKYKGRRISMPKGASIRPTSNKAREALFNIVSRKVPGAAVLDLFAGSGSLGIEALSRGAARAVFIDNDSRCIATIKTNLSNLGISGDIKLMQLNALQGIRKLSGKAKFDLVFLDPPYFKEWIKNCLINLDQYDILTPLGLCACEHHKKESVPAEIARLARFKQSRYGDTVLSFYEKKSGISGDI